MKNLYIIDASGFLYRSYFAIRNMTNAKGESTNALYGFIRSIMKLRKDFHPDHLVAVFDGPHNAKKREEIYPEYKAHRTAAAPDLIYQLHWARDACALMGIPLLSVPEVEADDTMGCVARWGALQGAKVFICTSDKDMCQVVDENISLLNTHKDNLITTPVQVEENFGVTPKQIVDYLSITGDASDNVPGIPGLGPKTAASLLKQFGTLDYLLEHPEAAGKKKDVLIKHKEDALLSRKLVTINTEVEYPKDAAFYAIQPCEMGPLKEFYTRMNFNSLIRELEQVCTEAAPQAIEEPVDYTLVDDQSAFDDLMQQLSKHKEIGFTAKTSQERPVHAPLTGISFSIAPKQAWYVPTNGKLGLAAAVEGFKALFNNSQIAFYGHNIKSDIQALATHGITIHNIALDTMLASYLLNSHSRQHSLESLMLELFGKVKMPLNLVIGKGKTAIPLSEAPLETVKAYACEEADYITRLKQILEPQIHERHLTKLFNDLELPLVKVLARMEQHGIYLDVPFMKKLSEEVNGALTKISEEIATLVDEPFNINSPKQLGDILTTKFGFHLPKTATGFSTSADVLEVLKDRHPIIEKILNYRTLEKLRSTYIDSLPQDVDPQSQRIHCTFNQFVAATGRLSCQDPNLQNIPIRTEEGRKIRAAFRPQKHGWSYLSGDYSQIELRLLAHLSDDPGLIQAFRNGEDIHTYTASLIFDIPKEKVTKEQRYGAKAVNFGIVYGQQAFGLAKELDIDVKKAGHFIDTYFQRYPNVRAYLETRKELARQTGKAVTYTGRERLIPEIKSSNGRLRIEAERLAINTPLQGTAADLIKMAMLKIDQRLKEEKLQGYMILQIHDELVFEAPDEEIPRLEPIIRDIMQGVLELKIPLVVDISIGKNWAEC